MIRITVEITERATSRRVSITAPSIMRALEMAGDGLPGRRVRVLFPISPEQFFAGSGAPTGAAPEPSGLETAA